MEQTQKSTGTNNRPQITIYYGDNIDILYNLPSESISLIYIDPPFNTGKTQSRQYIKTIRSPNGDRTGFQGKRYKTIKKEKAAFKDKYTDYMAMLEPRLREAYRILKPDGSLFLHIDYREARYCGILLDEIFGRESFINEIIWAYDYGARSKKKWSVKHNNILWYAKNPQKYTFNYKAIDRVPYLAPQMVTPEKARKGKTLTDVWWNTIVPTNSKEKTGYPTQKPLSIVERIVRVHSNPGDTLLDFFAGSGTLGEAAYKNGRNAILIDNNKKAIQIMLQRLAGANPTYYESIPQ